MTNWRNTYFAQRVHPLQAVFSLNTKLSFGKFKGFPVGVVLEYRPDYLEWALTKNIISVTKEIKEAIYDKLTYRG